MFIYLSSCSQAAMFVSVFVVGHAHRPPVCFCLYMMLGVGNAALVPLRG